MPILKYSEDLNGLNKAKRTVNKHLRRNFQGKEHSVDGGTSAKVEEIYEEFKKKLVAFRAVIFELQTSFALTVGDYEADANDEASMASDASSHYSTVSGSTNAEGRKPAVIADRFVGASSRVIQLIEEIISFSNRVLKNTLNMFSPQQLAEIAQLYTEIESGLTLYAEQTDELQHEDARAYYAFDDISSKWLPKTSAYFNRLGDMIDAYNKGVGANPSGEPLDLENMSIASGAGFSGGVFRVGMGASAYMPHRYL
jgi:hypothetical protein